MWIESENTKYFGCCEEVQFEYTCDTCGEKGGCMFCDFNPDEPCDCEVSK